MYTNVHLITHGVHDDRYLVEHIRKRLLLFTESIRNPSRACVRARAACRERAATFHIYNCDVVVTRRRHAII